MNTIHPIPRPFKFHLARLLRLLALLALVIIGAVSPASAEGLARLLPATAALPGPAEASLQAGQQTGASPQAPQDTPTTIVSEYVNTYAITDGLLYWGDQCYGGEFTSPGYLRRMPSHGGIPVTLQTTTASTCYTFWHMAADASGVYYVDYENGALEFYSASEPDSGMTVYLGPMPDSMTTLVLDDTYIYWGDSNTNHIYRLPKKGGSPTSIANTATGLTGLVDWYGALYWLDSTGLWTCPTPDCTSPAHASTTTGNLLRGTQWGIFWVEQSSPQRIHLYTCFLGCGEMTVYTADAGWIVEQPALGLCANGTDVCLYWTEYPTSTFNDRLRRMPYMGGTVDTLIDNLPSGNQVEADDQGVYFILNSSAYLARLPFSASVVQRDIQAAGWEVTQVVQSLENDVPLVARKPTYVRVYPSVSGARANNVQAQLVGLRDGSPLPGSPLTPLNGTISMSQGWVYQRRNLNDGYLFQLPESWTEAGAIDLEAILDPRNLYVDQNTVNNRLSGTFTFIEKPPVCDIFIPVRTHTPAVSTDWPNFWRMIDMQRRLWPVPDVWVYHEDEDVAEPEVCWWGPFPYPCTGPFELDEGISASDWIPDDGEVLLHLAARDIFSDNPDECGDLGSAVHYIGMVHPDAPANWAGLAYGYDWMPAVSWVKLVSPNYHPNAPWDWPKEGDVLAHETSHNHSRKHVDCGNPADPDPNYPYPPCSLDDNTDPTHYGFDVNTRQPISPGMAADYMSYNWWVWVSDYTYKAMFGRFAALKLAGPPALAAASDAVLVSAAVDPASGKGILNFAWVYPTSGMSLDMLNKWQSQIAQPFEARTASPQAVNYHLRLLNASGGTLADFTLTPLNAESHTGETHGLVFQQTFSAPAGAVSRLDLMAGNAVLASRTPGATAPAVQILQPSGGEVYNNSMTISWQASDTDGDALLFNLQYSPDNGATWHSITENLPAPLAGGTSSVTLDDLAGLGASQGATGLIRVAASDGYHTTISTSAAFTITNQPPEPYIVSPEAGQVFTAGESVPLSGGAMDPETGGLSGAQLTWIVGGQSSGTGVSSQVDGLAPGDYPVILQATDPDGKTASQPTTLTIGKLVLPLVDTVLTLDGSCEDAAYTGPTLRLQRDGQGNQAEASLLRLGDALWVCFHGMRHIEGLPAGMAALRIDPDNSRDALTQVDDYAFFVSEDGTFLSRAGNGAGGFTYQGPVGMQAQVGVQADSWSAEMRIPVSAFGGWNHPASLEVETSYNWDLSGMLDANRPLADYFRWPFASTYNSPATWAQTLLGEPPVISSLNPAKATVGGGAFTLRINGGNFHYGTTAAWNGASLPTAYISSTQVTAQVAAGFIAASGYAAVTVTNPDTLSSDPASFTVENPAPSITSLSPSRLTAGSGAFVLSVAGSGFVTGAQIFWNGEALTTTFLDAGHLRASLSAQQVAYARVIGVSVLNPSPAGGLSNVVDFTIQPLRWIYLPMMKK